MTKNNKKNTKINSWILDFIGWNHSRKFLCHLKMMQLSSMQSSCILYLTVISKIPSYKHIILKEKRKTQKGIIFLE